MEQRIEEKVEHSMWHAGSFHAQHLAFGGAAGFYCGLKGWLWKVARFGACLTSVPPKRTGFQESGPSNKKHWVNHQGQEQMVKMVKWEAFSRPLENHSSKGSQI